MLMIIESVPKEVFFFDVNQLEKEEKLFFYRIIITGGQI